LNYPFLSEQQNQIFDSGPAVRLENPLQGDFPELRKSLLPGLIVAAQRNLSRSNLDVAIFEEGSVFLPTESDAVADLPVGNRRPDESTLAKLNASIPEQPRMIASVMIGNWLGQGPSFSAQPVSYSHAVSAVNLVAKAAGLQIELEQGQIPGFHPGRSGYVLVRGKKVGVVGELHPSVAKSFHITSAIAAFELNLDLIHELAPSVLQAGELRVMTAATQDLSLVVETTISAADLANTVAEGAGELLERVTLVDEYRGQGIAEGKKSLTFSLVFRAADKTLTQQEASVARDAAVTLANQRHGAELRA
jgi:phenylalanyl-tRNA synthetase beta chain